jgi:hypothetical protein
MRRLGDAPIGSMRGLPRGDTRCSGGDIGGEGSNVGVVVVDAVSVGCLLATLSFFLPRPNSFFPLLRMLPSSVALVSLDAVATDAGGLLGG